MTLKKLASLTGISVSTISKAFADSEEISEKTKNIIFETARKEGCFEKYYKGKYHKKVIAVICPEINSEYYSREIEVLERLISKMGAMMVVSVSNFDKAKEKELFEYHSFLQKADGIIIIGSGAEIANSGDVPAVALNSGSTLNIDCVASDLSTAVDEAVLYLKENGHNDIAYAGEEKTAGKLAIIEGCMKKHGLELKADNIFISETRFEDAGRECAIKLLEKGKRPTAVFAAYDHIAIGMIDCLCEHGVKVPEDISVVGFDDISAAAYNGVELTSIRMVEDELCEIALDLLKKKMDNKYAFLRQKITVNGKLVKRKSVGRAKL